MPSKAARSAGMIFGSAGFSFFLSEGTGSPLSFISAFSMALVTASPFILPDMLAATTSLFSGITCRPVEYAPVPPPFEYTLMPFASYAGREE